MQTIIRIRTVIVHDEVMFIRTIYVFGAETYLQPMSTTCRTSDIVHTIDFVRVRALNSKSTAQRVAILKPFLPYLYDLFLHRMQVWRSASHTQKLPFSVPQPYGVHNAT